MRTHRPRCSPGSRCRSTSSSRAETACSRHSAVGCLGGVLTITGPVLGYSDQALVAGDHIAVEPNTPLLARQLAVQGPVGGLVLTTHSEPITTDTDATTVTFDCGLSNWHSVTLAGDRTLALANVVVGQLVTIVLVQDATGSRTVTWFSTVKWAGELPPTLTTTPAATDVFSIKCTGVGAYIGLILGQAARLRKKDEG